MGDLTGLGRLVQHDRKNAAYPMPLMSVPTGVRRRMWNASQVLDQGGTPQCVGYAGWGWLAGGPVVNIPRFLPQDFIAGHRRMTNGRVMVTRVPLHSVS